MAIFQKLRKEKEKKIRTKPSAPITSGVVKYALSK